VQLNLLKHIIDADAARLSTGRSIFSLKSIMQIIFYNIKGETK